MIDRPGIHYFNDDVPSTEYGVLHTSSTVADSPISIPTGSCDIMGNAKQKSAEPL